MRWALGPAAAKSDYHFHRSAQNPGEMFLPVLSEPPNTKKSLDAAGNKFLCTSVCSAGLCRGWIFGPGFGDFLDLQSLWKVCSETPAEAQQISGAFSRRGAGSCPRAVPWDAEGMESRRQRLNRDLLPSLSPSTMGHSPFSFTRDESSGICTHPVSVWGSFCAFAFLGEHLPSQPSNPEFQSHFSSTRL